MRSRDWNPTVRLLVLFGLAAVLAPLAAIAGPVPDASACSFAPATIGVTPSPEVTAGEWLKVRGSGFVDISFEPVEPEIDPDTGETLPQNSCAGLVVRPKEAVVISIGGIPLVKVAGPEFVTEVQVPSRMAPGWTTLTAGTAAVELVVGPSAPEPCPLTPSAVVPDHCEPCPVYVNGTTTKQAIPERCPDPCSPVLGGPAVWCPPEPCPVYLADAPLTQAIPERCPDPCSLVGGPASDSAAVWCPPEPCPIYQRDAVAPNVVVEDKCFPNCGDADGNSELRRCLEPSPIPAPVPAGSTTTDVDASNESGPRVEPVANVSSTPEVVQGDATQSTLLPPADLTLWSITRSVESVRDLVGAMVLGIFGG